MTVAAARMGEGAMSLARDGAERREAAMPAEELATLLRFSDAVLNGQSGLRVFDRAEVSTVLGPAGSIGRCAAALFGAAARPVRAILFDKTADNNWAVPWHQDRTIAVRARHDVPGFGPWSLKAGVVHVEPPFEIIEGMITIRAHLDEAASAAPSSCTGPDPPAGSISSPRSRAAGPSCATAAVEDHAARTIAVSVDKWRRVRRMRCSAPCRK